MALDELSLLWLALEGCIDMVTQIFLRLTNRIYYCQFRSFISELVILSWSTLRPSARARSLTYVISDRFIIIWLLTGVSTVSGAFRVRRLYLEPLSIGQALPPILLSLSFRVIKFLIAKLIGNFLLVLNFRNPRWNFNESLIVLSE